MKRVLLLGATGMLGSAVYKVLREKYDLTITARDTVKLSLLGSQYVSFDKTVRISRAEKKTTSPKIQEFDVATMMKEYEAKRGSAYFDEFIGNVGDVDYVINAIGVTIPFSLINPALTFFVNTAFPHILARQYGPRLIHITTDCVYSGIDGRAPYNEYSQPSPSDIYGLSKSLGEPTDCLTIRTSIVGPELSSGTPSGLLGWFLSAAKPGATLNGFTDHLWNGITTRQFGFICDKIISRSNPPFEPRGLYHVFSNPVSKYEMLMAFKERYNRDCEIKPTAGKPVVRTLSTNRWLNRSLDIPSFDQMIKEM